MKKILLVLAALVFASPALADVNITVAQVGEPCDGRVVISWDATSELDSYVRAFGLNITLDNDANVASATGLSADYWVYPGTIVIAADGTITDNGSIAAEYGDLPSDTLPGPPDGNGVTLECASLYAPVGPTSPNVPAKSGDLAELIIDKTCWLCISANVSRAGAAGVVMEDPDQVVTVNYPECIEVNVPPRGECMKQTAPEYDDWEAWGKPKCWCYARQCRGDIDGTKYGPFWVGVVDLDAFKAAFNKSDTALPEGGICADLDHTKYGPFRVGVTDLDILKAYFNKAEAAVPCCDADGDCILTSADDFNNWEEP